MAYSYQNYQPNPPQPNTAQNLQFYPSSYSGVSGHTTPSQASYGNYGAPQQPAAAAYPGYGAGTASSSFGGAGIGGAISGRMGDSSQGLRTGWLAAFGTEVRISRPNLICCLRSSETRDSVDPRQRTRTNGSLIGVRARAAVDGGAGGKLWTY